MVLDLGKLEDMKFQIGSTYFTNGVHSLVQEDKDFANFVANSFKRHVNGDWGDLDKEDKALNDMALESGEDRLFSKYIYNGEVSIYIITEWDRSATTILFPEEY